MEEEKIVKIVFEIILITSLLLVSFIVAIVYFRLKRNEHLRETKFMQQAFASQLLQSQIEVQEQTRLYLAEELHDNIGALSSLIKINLTLLSLAKDEERKHNLLKESQNLIKTLILDVKHLSISLNTNKLTNLSIAEAVYLEVQRIEKLQLFTINFSIEGDEVALPDDKQLILFRICQELLHNILKHAQPTTVTVALSFTNKQLQIIIADDGIGFDVKMANKKITGSGLINLHNRAKVIGGSLYLTSNGVIGTHCTIQIPAIPLNS